MSQTFFTASETRYLGGPIIWPGRAWEFPERLRAVVPLARWIQIRRGLHDEAEADLASEEEALGYLSGVSLEAPLDRDWADIFFHLGLQVFPRWQMLPAGQSACEAIGLSKPIVLDRQQTEELRKFRRWLRQKIEANARRPARQRRAAAEKE